MTFFNLIFPSTRFNLLQDQLRQKDMNLTFYNSDSLLNKRRRTTTIKPSPQTTTSSMMMMARRSEPSKPSMVQDTLTLEKTELDLNATIKEQQQQLPQVQPQSSTSSQQSQPQQSPSQQQTVQSQQQQQQQEPQLQQQRVSIAREETTKLIEDQQQPDAAVTPVVASRVPRLPDLKTSRKIGADFEDLYSRYSKSDREFIEKFPAKVELTVTDVGKQFIDNEKRKHVVFKRNMQNFHSTQENALEDKRFKNLVNYLVTPNN